MGENSLSLQELHSLADDLARQRSLFKTINDFAVKLLQIPSATELAWYVAREVVGRMGFDDCVVYLVDRERALLRQTAAIGVKNPHANQIINALEIPVGQGITGTVAATREPLIIGDLAADPRYIPDVEPALSEICVPLVIDDRIAGVIDCEDPRPNHYTREHLDILTTVAAMTSAKLKLINEARQADDRSRELTRLNAQLREQIVVRERAEADLERSRAQLLSVMDNSPALISLKDLNGRYTYINPSFCKYFETTPEETIGKTADDLLAADIAAGIGQGDAAILGAGPNVSAGEPYPVRFGSSTLLLTKFAIRHEDGSIFNIGTIGIDVTAQKQAEERLRRAQKMEAVGQLTGGVAHDFNNLLAVILGNAELLALNEDPPDPRLQAIIRSADRGSELTQRLLSYSRQQPLIPRPINLAELADGLIDLLTRTLGETITIETTCRDDLWPASVDPGQVENALLNLAINARDAMPDGGRLAIACANVRLDEAFVADHPETTPGDYVALTVSDTGTGMPSHVRDRVFEPFFTTKGVGEGSGLGLSMVYGFAKQSGGHVEIDSTVGQGTTVTLYLPRADAEPAMTEISGAGEPVPRGKGETILVIEDDAAVRAFAADLLGDLGYRPRTVRDAAAARASLRADGPVDLILSDVVLTGGTSGPEFVQEVRRDHPAIKVIYMSGYAADKWDAATPLSDDTILLNKPFQRRELATALRDALDS